jgi:hypothetical protein
LIEPGAGLDYNQELTKLSANGLVQIRRYQDYDDLDDEIYRFNLNGRTEFTERFGLNGRYDFIKDTTLDSELEEIGRIFAREDRISHNVTLSPRGKLNERTSIGVTGRYRNVSYDSDDDVDYSRWEVNIPVRWRLETQIDTVYIQPGYTDIDSDTRRSASYNFRAGWSHQSTERLNLNLSVGVRYTEHEEKETDETDETWNGLGALKLRYELQTGDINVDFHHDLRNTADGEQANVSRVFFRLNWNFTERMGLGLDGRYYYTQTEGLVDDETTEYMQVGPELYYNLTENHVVFIAYEYSQEYQKDLEDDPRAERNRIWGGFKLNFPI